MSFGAFLYLLLAQAAQPQKKEIVIYRDNVAQYKDRLIAPLVSWVESDLFRFKARDNEIVSEKISEKVEPEQALDKVIQSQNYSKNVVYDASFSWLTGEKLLRNAKVIFYRKYSSFPPTKQEDVLYEEVFRFIDPAVVNSYATQTFRFNDGTDQISHYSPVVGAVRPIQEANRSDAIIDGEIALDDIFVFSANLKDFNFKLLDQKVLFVPFTTETAQPLEKATAIFSYKNSTLEKFDPASAESYQTLIGKQSTLADRSLVLWNYEVKAFSSHATWLPLTTVFEPRMVLIYEIYPNKDPFYSSGKQYLFIDAQNGMPYYKLVYSHSGEFLKTVIGGWHKVADNGYVPVFVLAVDRAAKNATVLTVHNAQFYTDKEPNLEFVFSDQQQKAEM